MAHEITILLVIVLAAGSDVPSLLQELTNALETLVTFSAVTLVPVNIHIHLPSQVTFFSTNGDEDGEEEDEEEEDEDDEGPKGGMEVIEW